MGSIGRFRQINQGVQQIFFTVSRMIQAVTDWKYNSVYQRMVLFLSTKGLKNYTMKKFLLLSFLLAGTFSAICQSKSNYAGDVDKAYGLIRNGAYKNGYKYLIKFASTNQAAISVEPNTSYLIFFVYDNTNHPKADFQAPLMTPDSALMKKYTLKPFDRAQVGVARGEQLEFRTPEKFITGETKPVKLKANPPAYIYVYYKK